MATMSSSITQNDRRNAYSTLYGHMRSVATSAGRYVNQGDLIGYVGSTGNSTGNHLHLEVWKGGSKANASIPAVIFR